MKPKLQYAGAMAAFGTISLFVRSIPLSSGMLALMRAAAGRPVHLRQLGRDALPLLLSGAAILGFRQK